MLTEIRHRSFSNGIVYALKTEDGFPIEVKEINFEELYNNIYKNKETNYERD